MSKLNVSLVIKDEAGNVVREIPMPEQKPAKNFRKFHAGAFPREEKVLGVAERSDVIVWAYLAREKF